MSEIITSINQLEPNGLFIEREIGAKAENVFYDNNTSIKTKIDNLQMGLSLYKGGRWEMPAGQYLPSEVIYTMGTFTLAPNAKYLIIGKFDMGIAGENKPFSTPFVGEVTFGFNLEEFYNNHGMVSPDVFYQEVEGDFFKDNWRGFDKSFIIFKETNEQEVNMLFQCKQAITANFGDGSYTPKCTPNCYYTVLKF